MKSFTEFNENNQDDGIIPQPTHICIETIPAHKTSSYTSDREMKLGTLLTNNHAGRNDVFYEVPDYEYKTDEDRYQAWIDGGFWNATNIESKNVYKLSTAEVNVAKKENVKKLLSIILPSSKYNI